MERVKAISEIVQNFVVAITLFVAGIGALIHFGWVERPGLRPHLATRHCITAKPLTKSIYLATHTVRIKNQGKVSITPDEIVFMLLRADPPKLPADVLTAITVPDPGEPEFKPLTIKTYQQELPQPRKISRLLAEESISLVQAYTISLDPRSLYAFGVSIRDTRAEEEWFGGPTVQLSDILNVDCSQTRQILN